MSWVCSGWRSRPNRWKCRHVRRRIDATQVVRPDVTQVLRDGGHRAREPMGAIDEQKAVQAEYVVARRLRQHRHHAADGAVVPVTRTCTVISLLPDAAVNYALNVTHCCYPAPQRRIGRLLIARNPMQDTACCVAGGRHTGLPSRRHAHDIPKSHPCALCRLSRSVRACRSWVEHDPGRSCVILAVMPAGGGDASRHLAALAGQLVVREAPVADDGQPHARGARPHGAAGADGATTGQSPWPRLVAGRGGRRWRSGYAARGWTGYVTGGAQTAAGARTPGTLTLLIVATVTKPPSDLLGRHRRHRRLYLNPPANALALSGRRLTGGDSHPAA